MSIPFRILIAKVGLDGHDRGAKIIARSLRDEGFEVIYSGLHRTPKQIVHAAIQEDVKAIGVSILSGSHLEYFHRILTEIEKQGVNNVLIFGGGIIPAKDIDTLLQMGVARIFTPGSTLNEISEWLKKQLTNDW